MPDQRVIIAHPDGRRYSVTRPVFAERYEPQGFEIEGEETPAAFVADVPRPVRRAGARRKSRKAIAPKPTEADDATEAGA